MVQPIWVISAAFLTLIGAALTYLLHFKNVDLNTNTKNNYLIAGFFALLFSPILIIPPYMRDDMIYHLLVPKQMVMMGYMAFDPFNINSNFPMLFEMPYVILEMFKTLISPFVINIFWTIILLLVFYTELRKRIKISNGAAFLIVVALGTTPIIFDLLHSCYVEIFFALLITLATIFYLDVLEKESRSAWIKTCICLGLSAAVKYPGVLFIGFFCTWEFFRSKDRKYYYLGILITLLLAAPWYVKNTLWTGNPVFPLANTLFPSSYLSEMRVQGFHHMLADYNMGKTFIDIFLLPFRLAFGIDLSRPGMGLGFDGKLSLLFGAALFGLGWKEKSQRFISLLFLFYFSVWIRESQQARFLLPILSLPLIFFLQRFFAVSGFRLWVHLLMGLVLIQNGYNIYNKANKEKISDLLLGKIDRDKFLTSQMPISYGMAAEINSRLNAKTDKLMTVGCFGRNYYFDASVMTNTFYDQEVFRNAFERGNLKPDSVSTFLSRNHVTHILINWEFVGKFHEQDVGFDVEAAKIEFNSKWKLIMDGEIALYSIILFN